MFLQNVIYTVDSSIHGINQSPLGSIAQSILDLPVSGNLHEALTST